MINDNSLRENFKKILDIKKIFEKAKSDNGQTFLDKINNLDSNILKEQLKYYSQGEIEKVKKIRCDIINGILSGNTITFENIEQFKNKELKKYDGKDIFRSWKNFSILYSIYYFDKKDFVNQFLLDLNNQIVIDLDIKDLVKINIVDFQGAQNFGLENFWTAIYSKSHKSQKTALQLSIVSSGKDYSKFNENEIGIGIGCGPDAKKEVRNHKKINIKDLTYSFILSEISKYKNDIINDNYIKEEKVINKQNYWMYSPGQNASKWDEFYEKGIMGIGWDALGNLNNYPNKKKIKARLIEIQGGDNPMNDTQACEDFVRNIKIGDIIIPKQGRKNYLGYGIVEGNYEFDENLNEYKSIRKIKWIKKGIWVEEGDIVLKTLTNLDKYPDYVEKLKILLGINSANNNIMQITDKTSKLLDIKKQIILYGPPGTGKTYNIKDIIQNHSGETYVDLKNEGRIEFITFHQSFSYEEFIEGIKPLLNSNSKDISYKIENGIFKKISMKANENYQSFNNNIEELEKKELFNSKVDNLDTNKTYQLRKGTNNTFKIISKTDNEIQISSNSSTFKDIIFIKISELEKIYFSEDNINTNKKSANLNGYKWGRQEDSYLLVLVDEFKKQKIKIDNIEKENLKPFYLIIDEINRGNISKIFGELITLLEADKRLGEENEIITKLPYSKEDFGIPSNLYIVATMNTSDKSIVSLDTALRRRFGFKEMLPDYNLVGLNKDIKGINLSKLLQQINNRIEYLIDKDHLIGHSYFLKTNDIEDLKLVVYNEILPLLEEYFYGEEEKIKLVLGKDFYEKNNSFNDGLFENKGDFDNEENIYILKNLNDENFIKAIKNIINPNE